MSRFLDLVDERHGIVLSRDRLAGRDVIGSYIVTSTFAWHVGSVAPKVLTQTLRALERDGILTRTVYAQVPPRVEYQLTDLGHSLVTPIVAVQEWAECHVSHVLAARESYDLTFA